MGERGREGVRLGGGFEAECVGDAKVQIEKDSDERESAKRERGRGRERKKQVRG